MNVRVLAVVVGAAVASTCLAVACDNGLLWHPGEETESTSQAVITPNNTNPNVTPDYSGWEETSAAFVSGYTNDTGTGRWLVGWNYYGGGSATAAGLSISDTYKATTWTDVVQDAGTAWGNPGNSPYDDAGFSGWTSDPSIVAVTNPATNNGGKTMLYSMMACTNNCSENNDVVVAISTDSGSTWGGATYHHCVSSRAGAPVGHTVLDLARGGRAGIAAARARAGA